ncbi:MAG: high-potential iron-sulfur protein [Bdellovibrionaceae bacterium]|nr:high-potential iron-sulfur protein [Pseudobdellovibrionaceae bacterium]
MGGFGVMNRREFFVRAGLTVGLATLATLGGSWVALAEQKKKKGQASGGGSVPLVDPATDPTAKAVNYVHDRKQITKKELMIERQGVKFEQQSCANCSFYQEVSGGQGTCTIFAGKHVKAAGWCTSWNKKA